MTLEAPEDLVGVVMVMNFLLVMMVEGVIILKIKEEVVKESYYLSIMLVKVEEGVKLNYLRNYLVVEVVEAKLSYLKSHWVVEEVGVK